MLASLASLQGKEKGLLHLQGKDKGLLEKESLGSDGETSDYQRSTPSPRDGDSRITELITEGLEKCEDDTSSSCWKRGSSASSSSTPSSLTPSLSPDLGFVDCLDLPSTSYKSSCDKKLPFICVSPLKTNKSLPPAEGSASGPRGYSFTKSRVGVSPGVASAAKKSLPPAKPLLKKKVSVEIKKLPTVVSSLVDKNMFLVNKPVSSPARAHAFAKSRFDSGRTKEILLPKQGIVLNSFRIAAKPPSSAVIERTETNFTSFATRTFYKTDKKNFNDNNSSDNVSKTDVSSSKSSNVLESISGKSCVESTSSKSCVESISSISCVESIQSISSKSCVESIQSISSEPCLSECSSVSLPGSPCPLTPQSSNGSSLVASPVKAPSETSTNGSSSASAGCRPFRFPTLAGNSSAIPCKWDGCIEGFKSHGKLSDHIKTVHMAPQLDEAEGTEEREFSCMWLGCKVYGMKSSSRSWLQKHVPLHGGKLMFTCIVEGCKMRFSSQVMLERHVNNHFSESSTGSSQSGPKKSIEGAPARKVLKRAGVKLKFRKLPFSARIFDFFDTGMMAGIRHRVSSLHSMATALNIKDDMMEFHSKAMSLRLGESGKREVHLRWMPENMIPDEWVPLDDVVPKKCVKISLLPESAKIRLQHELLLMPRTGKQSRKRKYVKPPSPFLTPDEVKRETEGRPMRHPAAGLFL